MNSPLKNKKELPHFENQNKLYSEIIVDREISSQRIDNYILSLNRKLPKSIIYKWLRSGQIRINGKRANPTHRLVGLEKLRLPPQFFASTQKKAPGYKIIIKASTQENIKKAIIYEDSECFVINKIAGIPCHAGSGFNYGIIDIFQSFYPKAQLIHRLDKDTSGCLIIAKSKKSLKWLNMQMREHKIRKNYLCIVKGKWPKSLKTIKMPLKKAGNKMQIDKNGIEAESHFDIIEANAEYSYLKVKINTGKTHQIRVHTSYNKCPILGDSTYGDFRLNKQLKNCNRMALHSSQIVFRPAENIEIKRITAPIPRDIVLLLADCKINKH